MPFSRFRERLEMLALLRDGGRGATAVLSSALLCQFLQPAAVAVATAHLLASVADTWLLGLLVFGLVLLVGNTASVVANASRARVTASIDNAHRRRITALAQSLDLEALESQRVQELLPIAAADPKSWVEKTPGDGAVAQLSILARYIGMVSSVAVVAAWSFWLVPVLMLPALAVREISRRQWLRHFRIWTGRMDDHRRYQYWGELTSAPSEAKEIRVFGLADWIIDQHQTHMHAHLDPTWADDRRAIFGQWRQALLTLAPLSAAFCAVLYGVAADSGSITLASAVLTAGWGVFLSITSSGELVLIEGARPGIQAARELGELAARPTPARATATVPAPSPWSAPVHSPLVEFRDVSFSYPNAERPVLDGLNLTIHPGERLAVVGLNGAGKSTLIMLLAGLRRPTRGQITADGRDLAAMEPDVWRRCVSVVFQEYLRYQLSLADNVSLGCGDAPDRARVEAAVRDAGLDQVVADRLPAGLDTPLTRSVTNGVDLSGGQWQQVAIARALYALRSGAQILVLDEPTAHLDVLTEARVFDSLSGLTDGITTVLVSHRLSTVRKADRIVLLDSCGIVESGSHTELMANDGSYAAMYRTQAERFARGFDDRLEEVNPA